MVFAAIFIISITLNGSLFASAIEIRAADNPARLAPIALLNAQPLSLLLHEYITNTVDSLRTIIALSCTCRRLRSYLNDEEFLKKICGKISARYDLPLLIPISKFRNSMGTKLYNKVISELNTKFADRLSPARRDRKVSIIHIFAPNNRRIPYAMLIAQIAGISPTESIFLAKLVGQEQRVCDPVQPEELRSSTGTEVELHLNAETKKATFRDHLILACSRKEPGLEITFKLLEEKKFSSVTCPECLSKPVK